MSRQLYASMGQPMRHLYECGALAVLCGAAEREGPSQAARWWHLGRGAVLVAPVSKARRSDCPTCRASYRARLRHRRAGSLRAAARQTECEDVARRLLAQAARLEAL